jgi:hypothetical protein
MWCAELGIRASATVLHGDFGGGEALPYMVRLSAQRNPPTQSRIHRTLSRPWNGLSNPLGHLYRSIIHLSYTNGFTVLPKDWRWRLSEQC